MSVPDTLSAGHSIRQHGFRSVMITPSSDLTGDPPARPEDLSLDSTVVEQGKRIVLVIPGRLFRDGIERVLQSPDRTVIASLESFDQLRDILETSAEPDLFIVAIGNSERAPEQLAHVEQLRAQLPAARWIMLSRRPAPDLVRLVGVTGKDSIVFDDLSGAVLKLFAELALLGCPVIPAELPNLLALKPPELPAGAMSGGSRRSSKSRPRAASPAVDLRLGSEIRLSEREQTILSCLIEGHSNKAIARKLHIAEATVKVHVKALLRKLQVSNRTQAAILALQLIGKADSQRAQSIGALPPASADPEQDAATAADTPAAPAKP